MHLSKFRSAYNLVNVNRTFLRTIAVNNASVRTEESNEQVKSFNEIPGPPSWPIIGPLLNFLPGGMFYKWDPLDIPTKLHKIYGPIVKIEGLFGQPTLILLYDPDISSYVLRSENWLPIRSGFSTLTYFRKEYKKDKPVAETGLLSDHGEQWKKFRSTVNPVLLQPKTIKLYNTVIDEVAQDMIKRMKSKRNEKNMIEGKFDIEMNLWALESIGVVALGGRLHCLDDNLSEDSPARRLIKNVHAVFEVADKLEFKPSLWRYYATKTFKEAMSIYAEQENLSKFFISKATEQLKNKSKSDDEKGVLEKLLEIDENYAYIMASDMLFAGVDTAANTVIATLYLLAKNPEKQQKLREEIISGSERKPYLKACIKEGMRVMPVVSGNIRMSTKEYNLLGYKIPKGTEIVFSHQYMALSEDQYPRPFEYIPERWTCGKDDPLYHGNAHPFSFSPFGFGVRSCIGRRIAELEIETFVSRVIENFQVEWFGPPPKVTQKSLNYITGPFNFIFKDI